MDLDELLEMLELSEPSDFEYFEDLAAILESDRDIPVETLTGLFNEVDPETVAELIKNYFDDMMEAMPDESTDVYLLLENIRRMLTGQLQAVAQGQDSAAFCEELVKFRRWYCLESEVTCEPIDGGDTQVLPVRDALTLARLQNIGGDEYRYDFDESLDYDLDEYVVYLGAEFEDSLKDEEADEEDS